MAFYYVKSGGSATGDAGRYASQQTGAFSGLGAYYNSIGDAVAATTVPVIGDYILCSDLHAYESATAISANVPDGVYVLSVDDANCNQYKRGAAESTTAGVDIDVIDSLGGTSNYFKGLEWTTLDDFFTTSPSNSMVVFEDCAITLAGTSTGDTICNTAADGIFLLFKNCDITFGNFAQGLRLIAGRRIVMVGGTYSGSEQIVDSSSSGGLGGYTCEFHNVDFSGMLTITDAIVQGGGVSADDVCLHKFRGCIFPASTFDYGFIETIAQQGTILDLAECTSTDLDSYWYFLYKDFTGEAEADTVQYLNATYDGSNGVSCEISTTANANIINPFSYKLAVLPAQDLSGASGKTYTVELVSSDAALTDADVWVELVTQDNTNQGYSSRVSTQAQDILNGSALTSSSEVWAITTDTEYKISKQITQKVNVTNSNVEVHVYVAKPSTTVNFDLAVSVA